MSSFTKFLCLVMSSILKVLKKGNYKHQKLLEEWDQNKETLLEGLTFYVKYFGSELVEKPNGERTTAEAIKNIVGMTKHGYKRLERVALFVNPTSICVTSIVTRELLFEIPINRISYCSADAHYNHVFAFIQSNKNDMMECHAFLCSKRKMAQAVTLTISQAFNIAYDLWEAAKTEKVQAEFERKESSQVLLPSTFGCEEKTDNGDDPEILLIDLNYEEDSITKQSTLINDRDDYFWRSNFVEFSANEMLRTLETSLADTPISQFVADKSDDSRASEEFFQDDANDLLLL